MKIRVMCSLLAASILAAVAGCNVTLFPSQSSLDMYLKGQLEAEKGNLPQALASLSDAIKSNPKMGLAYLARGDIYKKQGNYEQAATDFEKAVKLEPYNFNANFQLGVVYQYLKRFADAVVAYQRAVEIRPLDNDANMNLAMTYVQLGDPLRGLPYAQRAVQGNENSATAHANLGMLYVQAQYPSAAIDSFKKSLELDSHQAEVYVDLAQVYINDKKYDQARNVLETGKALAPTAKVLDRLGFSYHMMREEDKAMDAFNEALRADPKYYQSLNGLGVVSMSRALASTPADVELAKKAIGYWNESLEINPNQDSIRNLVNTYGPKQ